MEIEDDIPATSSLPTATPANKNQSLFSLALCSANRTFKLVSPRITNPILYEPDNQNAGVFRYNLREKYKDSNRCKNVDYYSIVLSENWEILFHIELKTGVPFYFHYFDYLTLMKLILSKKKRS